MLRLRTELTHTRLKRQIEPNEQILLCGSCFTEHIGTWLKESGLNVVCNPWGVLFNPASIAQSLSRCLSAQPYQPEICHTGNLYHSFDHHGSIYGETPEALADKIQAIETAAQTAVRQADHLIITFGTAWVYERNGKIVANCHKAPANEFTRRRLSVEEIVCMWAPIVADRHVIFTVSPIRHIGDGLHGNQLSKATLLLAIDALQEQFPDQVEYIPAYELLMDDLRDYRFYADDLVHPSSLAIEAVKELVSNSAFSSHMKQYLTDASPLLKTLAHRPSDPQAPEYLALISKTSEKLQQLKSAYL